MESFRTATGLQTEVSVPDEYQARLWGASLRCAARVSRPHAAGAARHGVSGYLVYTHLLPRQLGGALRFITVYSVTRLTVDLPLCAQSSVALMDKAILPRPPLMTAARLAVDFNTGEFAPPRAPLVLTSRILAVQDHVEPYTVDVAVQLRAATAEGEGEVLVGEGQGEPPLLYASAVATFQKIGAVRSLSS